MLIRLLSTLWSLRKLLGALLAARELLKMLRRFQRR